MRPTLRPMTWSEKLGFDLRRLMFKWLPGTRPSGQPSPGQVMSAAAMLVPFGIGPETRLGKLLIGYFIAKTASEQPAYIRAIQQELQTGNYSDASRHAVEDALKIALIGAGIHGAIAGEGPKGPESGKAPEEPAESGGESEETKPDEPGQSNQPLEGSAPGNRTAAADASHFLEQHGDTYPLFESTEEGKAQSDNLQKWAEETGRLTRFKPPAGTADVGENEHAVHISPKLDRVYKATRPGGFGSVMTQSGLKPASPYSYLQRIQLMNQVFHSDIQVEGVTPGTDPAIITSQPKYQAESGVNPHPSYNEIADFMHRQGFELLPGFPGGWIRRTDGIMAFDVHPDNFINTKEGPRPVDLIVQKGRLRP